MTNVPFQPLPLAFHRLSMEEQDAAIKRRIREAAEVEERHFSEHRSPAEWLAFLLIPVGLPAADAEVPTIIKKPLNEVRLRV
jgi:hypothetical protein